MTKPLTLIAFDKKSARTVDANGFLHVAGCNISKATVNPYLGSEIPNYDQLGLDPKKVYQIYRPGEELTKAAATCNMIPLMDAHIEIDAMKLEDPSIAKHRVGSTGQQGEFKAPYLVNDLVITNAGAIAGIDSKDQCELSCAYRYDIVMTSGDFEGMKYDGYMTNISFNHVALVEEGRAGSDVMVKDSAEQLKAVRSNVFAQVREAMRANPIRIAMAMDYVTYMKGHRNSSGQRAPWVVRSESTGKVLWSGPSKKEAVKNLRRIEGHKAEDSGDPIDGFVDQLTSIKAAITKKLKPDASEEDGKALDDCTSAIDLAIHHLLDVKEDADEGTDANPEGINQYNGAAGSARAASSKAHASGSRSDHARAAKAHTEASHAAAAAGMKSKEASHNASASTHTRLAHSAHDRSVTKDIEKREDVNPKAGVKKYGEVKFADPKNKKYPLDTAAHVRSAASYFGMAKNRSQYSKEEQATIQSHIDAAEKKFKIGKNTERNKSTQGGL